VEAFAKACWREERGFIRRARVCSSGIEALMRRREVTMKTVEQNTVGSGAGLALDSPVADRSVASVALVATGGLLISFSPLFVRISSVGPTMAGFYRTLFGGLILAGITVARGERLWRGTRQLGLATAAAAFFALGLTCWHRSIHSIGPGLSTILANLQAFFLAFIALASLKERIGWRTAVALPMAIIGLVLLVGTERVGVDPHFRGGVALGLAAALAYALYIVALRRLQTNETGSVQLANFALVSLVCAVMMGAEGWLQGESFAIPDARSWEAMLAYGVLCQAAAWYLISAGLPHIPASRAGLLLLLQPTGAFVWDVAFFGRATTRLELVGALLALVAIYLGGAKKQA
jgi:drug/metabolite transporter (DMT)-like permease